MKRLPFFALLALAPILVGCDDDDDDVVGPVSYDLTLSGNDSFQGAHGGQDIAVAVVSQDDNEVVAREDGAVASDEDPAFEFSFDGVLEDGESYHVDYWIDSNFGEEAEAGECESPDVDHQWRLDVGPVNSDVTLEEDHRPADIESVCASFE